MARKRLRLGRAAPTSLCAAVLGGCGCAHGDPRTGKPGCPCIDRAPALDNITVNTATNQHSRWSVSNRHREDVDNCLIAVGVDRLQRPDERYCYPTDYGRSRCEAWDHRLLPECAAWVGPGHDKISRTPEECKGASIARTSSECKALVQPKPVTNRLPWCDQPWCYVDPRNCDLGHYALSQSYVFPGSGLWYSYYTCDSRNYFEIWGTAQLDLCRSFQVVEKSPLIIWFSCWACAFIQQIIDLTRYLEEGVDRVGKYQKWFLVFQLMILLSETWSNINRIEWSWKHFWTHYNLYVYVFINSSVFVRATMMSMIVWDYYKAKLLKNPVLPKFGIPTYYDRAAGKWRWRQQSDPFDGKGWTETQRAVLLVVICQFLSSLGIFGVVCVTHLIPGLFCYHWIFLLVAAVLVKSQSWVGLLGLDAEGNFARALVMGVNSFVLAMGIQFLVTCMVRVYAGEWSGGYLRPLTNGFLTRRLEVWVACHLSQGFSKDLFSDQDFINLFIR